VLAQSFRILTHATTEAMETIAQSTAAVRVIRPNLAGLSPWRLDVAEPLIQAHLAEARNRLVEVIDPWGHVLRESAVPGEPAPGRKPHEGGPFRAAA
jgi:hypothetical protein